MDSPPPTLTPEELALLPHDSKGPALIAVGWCLTVLASIFLGLRVYCKFLSRRNLWWDDWILIAAWVTLVIDVALATHLVVDHTYGRHSWDFRPPNVDKFGLVTAVRATFTITAIVWTKTAFATTLLRLADGWMRWFLWFIIISMNILMGLSALFLWIQCTPVQKSWKPSTVEGSCGGMDTLANLSLSSGGYSAAMDFVLAILPWKMIMGLQMNKREKIGVVVALSMGIIAGIAAIIKTVNLPKLASGDIYETTDLVIWDITEASVTMIAACIPVLRVLVKEVKSSAQRYYGGAHRTQLTQPGTGPGWDSSVATSAVKHPLGSTFLEISQDGSNKSDESILDDHAAVPSRFIQRTDTVAIQREPAVGGDGLASNKTHGHEYELRHLPV